MNIKNLSKIALTLTLLFSIFGCSETRTHGKFITEHENAWMNGYVVDSKGKLDRDDSATHGLAFCRANKDEDGGADPVCYRARFQGGSK